MVKFFVPTAQDESEADSVYKSIAKANRVPLGPSRIWRLAWTHYGVAMACEVGDPLPAYYSTGYEPVMAIFRIAGCFKICTTNRGAIRGEPVLAEDGSDTVVSYFEEE